MNLKTRTIFLLLLPLIFSLSSELRAQDTATKEVRRVRYIGRKLPDASGNATTARVQRRSAKLGRSEVSDSKRARIIERETFDLINLQRIEHGLAPLMWDPKLAELARVHSQNMARHGFFSHVGLNGRTVDARAVDSGIDDWRGIGENIAFNQGIENPASFAVEKWILSPGHRRNLLDRRWKQSGLGVAVTEDGKYFFTQVFMLRN